MERSIFKGAFYGASEDTETGEVSIAFLHARYMTAVKFILLESEKHRYNDTDYIEKLIDSYHRNGGKFSQKRKVTKL